MKVLIVVGVVVLFGVLEATRSGIQVRMNRKALNKFFTQMENDTFNKEIRNMELPLSETPSGLLRFTDTKVYKYKRFRVDRRLSEPKYLDWYLRDGDIRIRGNWIQITDDGFSDSGEYQVHLQKVNVILETEVEYHPRVGGLVLKNVKCNATIGKQELKILPGYFGIVTPSATDATTTTVDYDNYDRRRAKRQDEEDEDKTEEEKDKRSDEAPTKDEAKTEMKGAWEALLCDKARKFLSGTVNDSLHGNQLYKELGYGLMMDVSMTGPPVIERSRALFKYNGHVTTDLSERTSVKEEDQVSFDEDVTPYRSLQILIGEDVLNSYIRSAHAKGLFTRRLRYVESVPETHYWLLNECEKNKRCFGNDFPEIAAIFREHKPELLIAPVATPETAFRDGKIHIMAQHLVALSMVDKKNQRTQVLAMELADKGQLIPSVLNAPDGSRLIGTMDKGSRQIGLIKFLPKQFKSVLVAALVGKVKQILERLADKQFGKGLPLVMFPEGMTIQRTHVFVTDDNALLINGNLHYPEDKRYGH